MLVNLIDYLLAKEGRLEISYDDWRKYNDDEMIEFLEDTLNGR